MYDSKFLRHWLGQPADDYLQAHNNQVPSHDEMVAELTARKPPRDELIILVAATLRTELRGYARTQTATPESAPASAAQPEMPESDWTALCERLRAHPKRERVAAILRLVLDVV